MGRPRKDALTDPLAVIQDTRPVKRLPKPGDAVDGIQCHVGIAMGGHTATGWTTGDFRTKGMKLTVVGPGVFVEIGGHDYIVPWTNVLKCTLAKAVEDQAATQEVPLDGAA